MKTLSRVFNGKRFQLKIRGFNKAESTRTANLLKRQGFLVRIVPTAKPNVTGYSVWWRAESGHGY